MNQEHDEPRQAVWMLTVILFGASILYIAAITPNGFGYYHDDGIYVTTAKALATGQGYRILSLPYQPPQTKYPPFYPFLLSLIWRVNPHFPQNIVPMMIMSILATLVFLLLTWLYLKTHNYATARQALLAVAITAVNWRTTILATGIYSEMIYAALSVAALGLAENSGTNRSKMILLGLVLGLACLTRISGVSLLVSVISYYLLSGRRRQARFICILGGVFLGVWFTWCAVSATKVQGLSVPYYTSYLGDLLSRVTNIETLLKVAGINAFLLLFTSIPLVFLGIRYDQAGSFLGSNPVLSLMFLALIFFTFIRGVVRDTAKDFRLLYIYVLFYLGLHLLWPFTSYDRFLEPILPFLLVFIIKELRLLIIMIKQELRSIGRNWIIKSLTLSFIGTLLLGFFSIASYYYTKGIHEVIEAKSISAARASENNEAVQWITANTDPSAVLVCYWDPLYYLYTGRKAVRSLIPVSLFENQVEKPENILLHILQDSGGQYLILTSSDFEQESNSELLRKAARNLTQQFPDNFIPKFQSSNGQAIIYFIQSASLRNTSPS